MRLRRVLVAGLAALALVGACANDEEPTSEAPSEQGDSGAVEVELIEAGAEPRQPLRLEVAPGAERRATMRMVMSIRQEIDGKQAPTVATPPIDMVMVVRAEMVEGDVIHATFAYDTVTVVDDGSADPAVVQAMRESGLDQLSALDGTMRMTSRGELLDATVDEPGDLPAQLGQFVDQIESQLQNLTVPFPEEAVGPGARWSARTEATLGGIETETETSYRLVEVRGDAYSLEVSIRQTAPPQTADLQGTDVRIIELLTEGTGTLEGDLTGLMPVRSRMTADTDQTMELTEGGDSRLRQQLTLEVTFQ